MSAVLSAAPSTPAGPSSELVEAATAVLAAHDALEASSARESFRMDSSGLPVDRAGWMQWFDLDYRPAYDTWSAAMDRLATLMGPEFPGRHPWSFRPVCEGIVREDAWWRRSGLMGGTPRMGKASLDWARVPSEVTGDE